MFQTYKNKADFLTVYIKEAHPSDGWHMESMIDYKDPKTLEERKAALQKVFDMYDPKGTYVMDDMSNSLEAAYKAWPERLYVIKNGIVLYKGGLGPFDYSPTELKAFLEKL